MAETAYLKDGRQVEVVQNLDVNQFLVQEIFVGKETGKEYAAGKKFVVEEIFSEPVTPKKQMVLDRLQESIDAEKKRLDTIKKEIDWQVQKAKPVSQYFKDLNRNAKAEQLEVLQKFLEGRIHYLLVTPLSRPQIVKWPEDDACSDIDGSHLGGGVEGLKLISLFGSSKGDLSFSISRYRDGSGGYINARPFETYEEALAYAQSEYDTECQEFLYYGKTQGNRRGSDPKRWEKIKGIKANEEVLKIRLEAKVSSETESLERIREQLDAKQAQLNKLKTGDLSTVHGSVLK